MELLVVIPLVAVAVAVIGWTWWSARTERDPSSSVDSFHRALSAMEPGADSARRTPATRGHHAREATPDAAAAGGGPDPAAPVDSRPPDGDPQTGAGPTPAESTRRPDPEPDRGD